MKQHSISTKKITRHLIRATYINSCPATLVDQQLLSTSQLSKNKLKSSEKKRNRQSSSQEKLKKYKKLKMKFTRQISFKNSLNSLWI